MQHNCTNICFGESARSAFLIEFASDEQNSHETFLFRSMFTARLRERLYDHNCVVRYVVGVYTHSDFHARRCNL